MSLVKHSHGVLLVDREDDDPSAGGVDNAIILYRAIEKDGARTGRGRRTAGSGAEGGYSLVTERPGNDDVFTDRRHKSTRSRVG